MLKKERQVLSKTESQLKEQVMGNQKIQETLESFANRKSEFLKYSEDQVVQELQQEIDMLEEKITSEKELFEHEVIAMNKAYQDKLIELKEKEAVKDFEIGKMKKELQLLQNEYKEFKENRESMQVQQTKEIESLRKFVNVRQTEGMAQRQKMGENLKKMKEVIQEKEDQVKEIKNDHINKYLKIINTKVKN